jgi:endo-1,4-beta-mannosidase
MKKDRSIRFGLNYVPSQKWYYCWNDWSDDEIAADFDAMAALEIDHVRVMLVWPWFQPNPQVISEAHLDRLRSLMQIAAERNIDVLVCALTGWLSGYYFIPPNVTPLDVFRSPGVIDQIHVYFSSLLSVLREFTNFLGIDLGNEINMLAPDLPAREGDAWAYDLTMWLRRHMAGKWIVNGVDHQPWFMGKSFSSRHLIECYDVITLHAWPLFTSCLMRGGLTDPPACELSGFLTRMCRHMMTEMGQQKPIWIQEFGCSCEWGSLSEQEIYLRRSVENAIKAGATLFTWWCSHEIDPRYRFGSLEYDLGLLSTSNRPKPLANVFRSLIDEFADVPVSGFPEPDFDFGEHFSPRVTQHFDDVDGQEQNLSTTTWAAFQRFLDGERVGRSISG